MRLKHVCILGQVLKMDFPSSTVLFLIDIPDSIFSAKTLVFLLLHIVTALEYLVQNEETSNVLHGGIEAMDSEIDVARADQI